MVRLTIALALAATLAVATALFRDLSGSVDTLRDRLSASDAARRDVLRLLDENRRDVDARLARDVAGMHRDILGPSLQVNARGGVGGGTILSSAEGRTWAVTAWHVVQKAVREDGRDPVEVKLYDAGGAPAETVDADLVVWDEAKDLALLRLRDGRKSRPARLASRQTLRTVQVFTPLYAVGCPLGHDPLPTRGEVATLNKDVAGQRFWMMNAPTIYGNSGGGVFHADTNELIGVSVMICTYDGAVSTPVPHLGILAPLAAVYDWLDAQGYAHAYDPSASVEACEADRATEPDARNTEPVGRATSTAPAAHR
ncbi:MAG TPA: serine protease [Planctomycetota bacterium]